MVKKYQFLQLNLQVDFFATGDLIQKVELKFSDNPGWNLMGNSEKLKESISNWWELDLADPVLPPLDWSGLSPFETKVLRELQKIPFGKTSSYGEISLAIKNDTKSSRAVGGACRKNPFPFLIPCHRVVSKGSLRGYSQGVDLKEVLLNFERSF